MKATAQSFVGIWQGEHQAGFAKITIELQSLDKALCGTWITEAGAHADRAFPAIRTPIVNPQLNDETLAFIPINSPTSMSLRLISDREAIFEPILDAAQFNLNDPDIIKAIEGHQVHLRKIC